MLICLSSAVDLKISFWRPRKLRNSEKDVQQLQIGFLNCQNPFDMHEHAREKLICLSSDRPASEVKNDLLQYFSKGEDATRQFLKDRMVMWATK